MPCPYTGIFTSCCVHIYSGWVFLLLQHISLQVMSWPSGITISLWKVWSIGRDDRETPPVAASVNRQTAKWFTLLCELPYAKLNLHIQCIDLTCSSRAPTLWQTWCEMLRCVRAGTYCTAHSEEVHARSWYIWKFRTYHKLGLLWPWKEPLIHQHSKHKLEWSWANWDQCVPYLQGKMPIA